MNAEQLSRNYAVQARERDRLGRSSRRPADWLWCAEEGTKRRVRARRECFRRDAENCGRDARAPHFRRILPATAMSLRRRVSRSAALMFFCFGLTRPLAPTAVGAASEGSVPAPSRAFTPRTAIAFYADVQTASKSAIWNAITN